MVTPGSSNLIFIIGDFNAKLSNWNFDDRDTPEGVEIEALPSSYGLSQILSELTHILPNSTFCIDLLFTNQPNMISEISVYSLHTNCHNQIIYAKISFKIFYPAPYERQIWPGIKQSVEYLDLERIFQGLSIRKQVEVFNDYILNIFKNYIPNEILTVNDKDLPRINSVIKKKLMRKIFFTNFF